MNTQDNIQNNWRGSLENADHFPGETLRNKNEAWEKLYSRLHNKPQYKIIRWYWVAAACLLAIAITALLFIKNEKAQPTFVTTNLPSNNKTPEVTKKSILTGINSEKVVLTQKQQEKSTSVLPLKNNNAIGKIETIRPGNFISDSVNNPSLTTIITSNAQFDSSIVATIAPASTKKKLRVVHVNEIGQPAEESTAGKSIEKHGFEFRIINNEIYNPSATPVNNSLILFKLRNTSN